MLRCLPILAILAVALPAQGPAADPALPRTWFVEAHKETRDLLGVYRAYALMRLAKDAAVHATDLEIAWSRDAFAAAGRMDDPDRRNKARYQVVRNLAPRAPSAALDLALAIAPEKTGEIDWRSASVTRALVMWGKADPVAAERALVRVYAAGITDLSPAGFLLSEIHKARPELAKKIFQASVARYSALPSKAIPPMVEILFQAQAMAALDQAAVLKLVRQVLADADVVAKKGADDAAAAVGPRILALDLLRRFEPEEALRLAEKDSETLEMLKSIPVGATQQADAPLGDPAPDDDPPDRGSDPMPEDPAEEREVIFKAIRSFDAGEEGWDQNRMLEAASKAQSPWGPAQIRLTLALKALRDRALSSAAKREAARASFEAAGRLYAAEPRSTLAIFRPSTDFYKELMRAMLAGEGQYALELARELPSAGTRHEIMLEVARFLAKPAR